MTQLVRIYPYKMGSGSAKALSRAFGKGAKKVYPDGKFRPAARHLVVNWGNPRPPESWVFPAGGLNRPEQVAIAHDKAAAFEVMHAAGVPVPKFTSDRKVVQESLNGEMDVQWLARTLLKGHSGRGIEIIDGNFARSEVPNAPLYVEYVKKKHEFRVHVFGGNIIDAQQKKVREGSEGNDFTIRSYDNGWVFCRGGIEVPPEVGLAAIQAVRSLGLHFGAVDVGFNVKKQAATVYEVNTAPGLEGQTLDSYVRAIEKLRRL